MKEYELTVLSHPDLEVDLDAPLDKVRKLVADNGGAIEPLPHGSFRSAGTTVNTCMLTLTAGGGYA